MTTTASPSSPEPAAAQMLRMLNSFLTVQALHVAAVLDLAGLLADGPRDADELASDTRETVGVFLALASLVLLVGARRVQESWVPA